MGSRLTETSTDMNTMKLYKFHIHKYPEITHGIQVEDIYTCCCFNSCAPHANREENLTTGNV